MNERRNDSFLHSGDLVVSTGLVASIDLLPSCRNRFYILPPLSSLIPMPHQQKTELSS
jgi:hypothetical protein